jgi:hypothetical protein
LFIGLFNDAFSLAYFIVALIGGMICKLYRMKKELIATYFGAQSQDLSGGTERDYKMELSHGNRFLGRASNPGFPEYDTGVLIIRWWHLVNSLRL